jgi:iron complex transport system ATP-binding protein
MTVKNGLFFTLMGPNGSGKSTLAKLITGELIPYGGQVSLAGKPISQFTSNERAQTIAVLSQDFDFELDFNVYDLVATGRYPHQKGLIKSESAEDHKIIENAMRMTDIWHYANQSFRLLSGGEKQRVLLAKTIAQQPKIIVLDEPTNHLDIRYTVELLQRLKRLQDDQGITVFAIMHDLNLAATFSDEVAFLKHGKLAAMGKPSDVFDEQLLANLYGVPLNIIQHPETRKPLIFL